MGDDDLFRQEMAGIKPLEQDKVRHGREQIDEDNAAIRRYAAENTAQDSNKLASYTLKKIGPHDLVEFKRPGVQEGVYKKLRLGKYSIEARLDLHGMTVERARCAIRDFISECLQYDLRTVIILTGKGGRDGSKKAILKSHAVHWLEEMDEVMAFHSAQKHHGGAGALYVLLKKSGLAKQRNRELHGGRANG